MTFLRKNEHFATVVPLGEGCHECKTASHFTAEQKAEAVYMVEQSGKPNAQITGEMGIGESAFNRWVGYARIGARSI